MTLILRTLQTGKMLAHKVPKPAITAPARSDRLPSYRRHRTSTSRSTSTASSLCLKWKPPYVIDTLLWFHEALNGKAIPGFLKRSIHKHAHAQPLQDQVIKVSRDTNMDIKEVICLGTQMQWKLYYKNQYALNMIKVPNN